MPAVTERPKLDRPIPLGPFELHQFVGRGGMGVVWRGVHTEQGVPVAVKVLPGRFALRNTYLANFRDEVRRVAQFTHPGIVIVFDYGSIPETAAEETARQLRDTKMASFRLDAGSPYLVMEYCEGGSLKQRMGGLGWEEMSVVLLSILDGLAHAHARGVVHRDIKPDNILFAMNEAHQPVVKLTDFGISLAEGLDETTFDNRVVGTLPYMAPEQFEDWRDHGPWTDLYALGCLAYEMVAGKTPFRGQNPAEFAGQHMFNEPPPLKIGPDTPEEFEGWVARLLQKRPRDRFRCAADAAHALSTIAGDIPHATAHFSAEFTTLMLGTVDPSLPHSDGVTQKGLEGTPLAAILAAHKGDDSGSVGDAAMPQVKAPIPESWVERTRPPTAMSLIGAGMGLYEWRTIPLINRRRERDLIWESLLRVQNTGKAGLVLLRGDAGYGKSRLAEWIAQRALEVGAVTTVMRAEHNPIPGPKDGLRPMVADHLRCAGLDLEGVRSRVGKVLREHGVTEQYARTSLSNFVVSAGRTTPTFRTPEERYIVIERLLALLSRRRPVILVLEDVQWGSDALSFALHVMASQAEQPLPLLLLMTAREEILEDRTVEAKLVQQLLETEGAEHVSIGALGGHDQEDLVRSLLRLEGALAGQVVERTGGNPLFAVQLVGDWVSRGVLRVGRTGFVLRTDEDARIPETIHGMWQGRIEQVLAQMPPSGTDVLETAAALGLEVDGWEWEKACAQQDLEIPPALMERMLASHLAEPREAGWAFRHGMLRESIQADATAAGRWTTVNMACAKMLDESHELRGVSERIGRHLLEAERHEECIGPLYRGARERLDTSEFAAAGDLLEKRETILRKLDVPTHDERWGLGWVDQVSVHMNLGRFEEAAHLAAKAAESSRRHRWSHIFPKALRYQAMTQQKQGELGLAETVLVRAQMEAMRSKNREEEAQCLLYLSGIARMLGDTERALEYGEQAYARFAGIDDRRGMAKSLSEMGIDKVALDKLTEADELLHRALDLFEELGNRFGLAHTRNTLAEIHRKQGRLAEAEQQYAQAQEELERVGSPERVIPLLNRALLQLQQENYQSSRSILEAGLQIVGRGGRRHLQGYFHATLLPCVAAAEDWQAWDRHLAEADALVAETGAVDPDIAWPLQAAADLAWEKGERRRAVQALRLALDQWSALRQDDKVEQVEELLRDYQETIADD